MYASYTSLPDNGLFWKFHELAQCKTPIPTIAIPIVILSTIAIFVPVSISTSVFSDTTTKCEIF